MTSKYEEKINYLETKVNSMDKQNAVFEEIVKNFNSSIGKLFGTLDNLNITLSGIEKSMISMQAEIVKNTADVNELKTKFDSLDNDHKFNWGQFVNNRLIPLLLGGGTVWGITEIIKNLSK